MSNKRYCFIFAAFAILLNSTASATDSCESVTSESPISVVVYSDQIIRPKVKANFFGFTLDWFQFQNAFYRLDRVRPEVVDWLRPFKGAVYRYSGGNDFEWQSAVGPINKRKKIYANYQGFVHPYFGPSEFFELMQDVDGKAVVLLNVAGVKGEIKNREVMINDNLNYLQWLNKNSPGCVGGVNCPIYYFELGNEVDFEKPLRWSASFYSERVLPLIKEAKVKFPLIKFAVVGKTAPWDGELDIIGESFDGVVASNLARNVDAVTIHPYYDGYPVSAVESYINKLAKTYKTHNSNVKVLVTEHGRWPSIPASGDWEKNWYQASGSAGGMSSADFILMSMVNPNIDGAMWHTISATGPWQLFHLNKINDSVYPSAVYWTLRTLREGFLDDIVKVTPSMIASKSYAGGYDMRLIAMKNSLGQISLMGVNRSAYAKAINLEIKGISFDKSKTKVSIMQADEKGNDNIDSDQNRFRMKTVSTNYSSIKPSSFCIPPNATFSIVLGIK